MLNRSWWEVFCFPESNTNEKIAEGDGKQYKFLKSIYDLDLAKSSYSVNAAYIYHFKRKLNFRGNIAFAQVTADDAKSTDLGRKERNLNFKSNILELSAITEFYFAKPITGNKFNLKDVQGHKLAPNFLAHWGIYVMGGIGGFSSIQKDKTSLFIMIFFKMTDFQQ